jgi:hypothetical protein
MALTSKGWRVSRYTLTLVKFEVFPNSQKTGRIYTGS